MKEDSFHYLLDTNILSDLIRHPAGAVAQRIQHHGQGTVCTSIVVAAELRFGATKKSSLQLSQRVDTLLDHLSVLPLNLGVDHCYAKIRTELEAHGTPISPHDLFIASQAMSLDLILVSANIREFSRIKHIRVENWLAQ